MASSRRAASALFVLLFVLVASSSRVEAASGDGRDFGPEVRLLYRIVACRGDAPIPASLDRRAIDAYCERLAGSLETYRRNYVEAASRFLAGVVPAERPPVVVYPFGGGDLLSALTTFPEATDVTTLSLEHAGDPRRVATLDANALAASLEVLRKAGGSLLVWNNSKSTTLSNVEKSELPGQLSLFLLGLAVHGYEPVGLRFFRVEPSGALHYFDDQEIAAAEKKLAKSLHTDWVSPDFSEVFSNSELSFRPLGAGPDAPLRVHRHFAANLADGPLAKAPGILRHLEAKGRVSAMTKAASYLLWQRDFSKVREYLLAHMVLMVSDSTGIPPAFTEPAGFVQDTYGHFEGSYLGAARVHNDAFRALWARGDERPLPFRYGYIDASRSNHLVVTRAPRVLETTLDEAVRGGRHLRVWTELDAVHVAVPAGYRARGAKAVVVIVADGESPDRAWVEDGLADRLLGSGKNALYVVPEREGSGVRWKRPVDLVEAAARAAGVEVPDGTIEVERLARSR